MMNANYANYENDEMYENNENYGVYNVYGKEPYNTIASKVIAEMDEYKKDMLNQTKLFIFDEAWQINIMKNYYYFFVDNGLLDSYIPEKEAKWLAKHELILHTMLGETMSWDGEVSENWDDMAHFIYEVYKSDVENGYYTEDEEIKDNENQEE